MKRTIKFRGKNIETGKWVYGDVIHLTDGSCHILTPLPEEEAFRNYNVKPDTVCQFTGLLDLNEMEIYDGDIVRSERWQETYEVVWDNNICRYEVKDGNIYTTFDPTDRYLVLGNRFDNPELLEEDKP